MEAPFIYAAGNWEQTAHRAIAIARRMEKDVADYRAKLEKEGALTPGQKTALEIREQAYNAMFDLYEAANEYIGLMLDTAAADPRNTQIAILKSEKAILQRENKCMRRMLEERGVKESYTDEIILYHRPEDYRH